MPIREYMPSRASDLEAIHAIYTEQVLQGTASFELQPPSLETLGQRLLSLVERGYPVLVFEQRAVVLGYAYAGPWRPRPAYRFTVEDSIYLAPSARGRGAGTLLLTALIERCAALGCKRMMATIGDSANVGSIAVHRRCGFREVGVAQRIGLKFGRWIDIVYMQCDIGDDLCAADTPEPLFHFPLEQC